VSEVTRTVFRKGSTENLIRYVLEVGGEYHGRRLAISTHDGLSGAQVTTEETAREMAEDAELTGFRWVLCMTRRELRLMQGYAKLDLFAGGGNGDDPEAL
jgi:hypothetical protein